MDLGWGLRFCISNWYLGDAQPAGPTDHAPCTILYAVRLYTILSNMVAILHIAAISIKLKLASSEKKKCYQLGLKCKSSYKHRELDLK